eukprot:15472985-Alexandrium_andersonii.AAC.1
MLARPSRGRNTRQTDGQVTRSFDVHCAQAMLGRRRRPSETFAEHIQRVGRLAPHVLDRFRMPGVRA